MGYIGWQVALMLQGTVTQITPECLDRAHHQCRNCGPGLQKEEQKRCAKLLERGGGGAKIPFSTPPWMVTRMVSV